MKSTFIDYKIFVTPEFNQISSRLTGNNNKNILIINSEYEASEMTAFLEKILAPAQLSLSNDCLLLTAKNDEKFPPLAAFLKENSIKKVLVFGFSPHDIGLNIQTPQYFVTHFNNCTYLFSPQLSVINNSADHKRGLWNCLKSMFLD